MSCAIHGVLRLMSYPIYFLTFYVVHFPFSSDLLTSPWLPLHRRVDTRILAHVWCFQWLFEFVIVCCTMLLVFRAHSSQSYHSAPDVNSCPPRFCPLPYVQPVCYTHALLNCGGVIRQECPHLSYFSVMIGPIASQAVVMKCGITIVPHAFPHALASCSTRGSCHELFGRSIHAPCMEMAANSLLGVPDSKTLRQPQISESEGYRSSMGPLESVPLWRSVRVRPHTRADLRQWGRTSID